MYVMEYHENAWSTDTPHQTVIHWVLMRIALPVTSEGQERASCMNEGIMALLELGQFSVKSDNQSCSSG